MKRLKVFVFLGMGVIAIGLPIWLLDFFYMVPIANKVGILLWKAGGLIALSGLAIEIAVLFAKVGLVFIRARYTMLSKAYTKWSKESARRAEEARKLDIELKNRAREYEMKEIENRKEMTRKEEESKKKIICRHCGEEFVPKYIHCSPVETVAYLFLFLLGVIPFLLVWLIRSRVIGCPKCKIIHGLGNLPSEDSTASGLIFVLLPLLSLVLFVSWVATHN